MTDPLAAKRALAEKFGLTLGGLCTYEPYADEHANERMRRVRLKLVDVWVTGWDNEMGVVEFPDGESRHETVVLHHLKPA